MCAFLQNNVYRLGLLTHLQNEHVPLKVPECLRDLRTMYEAATIDDVNDAYTQFQMDDDHVFTCVGTSGEIEGSVMWRRERCSPVCLSQGTTDSLNCRAQPVCAHVTLCFSTLCIVTTSYTNQTVGLMPDVCACRPHCACTAACCGGQRCSTGRASGPGS